MFHQRQKQVTCAVQALNNAAGVPLITISEAHAACTTLNEGLQASTHVDRHGHATGNFSIATVQAALQAKHGRRYVLCHVKRLTERKARKWLCKQQSGRFIVLEYNASKDTYHWIAVHAKEQLVIDGALKKPFKLCQMSVSRVISKVYRVELDGTD